MSSETKRVDISAMEPATATVAVDTSNQLYRSYLSETQNSGGTQIPVLEAETVSVEDVMRMREAEAMRKPVVLLDKRIEGLSRRRDDYYPASLARDPKPQLTEQTEVELTDETKRRFKKPREVSLVADYIRRFLKTEHYDLSIPLKDQLHVVEILKRKLQVVFPAGEWETSIVKALIREKTKKKRISSIGGASTSLGVMRSDKAKNISASSKAKKVDTPSKRQRLEVKPAWALQLEQQVVANTAAIQNDRTRALNVGTELRPLLKERAGLHPLTNLIPKELQPAFEASLLVPTVGSEPYRDLFPCTELALRSLSQHQILRLIEFYNDDMHIAPSDDLETRRRKFSIWARK